MANFTSKFLASTCLLALAACGETGDDVPTLDCSTADVRPYSELGAVFANCTGCHSGNDAPESVRFDSYADAAANALRGAAEVSEGSMPPGGGMSEADKQALYAWARCGTPE
jgi:hypothetical protein